MTQAAAAQLRDRIAGHFLADPPDALGVAVSGGGDSMALLALLTDWRDAGGPRLVAVTVDHGLRPEAAGEARMVARLCAQWEIPHDTLHWHGAEGPGNLPDRARRARYALMAGWAAGRGISCIALGHTLDDQAETFLMRLAREAGLDGLSAMTPDWRQDGVRFARPLLDTRRAALRELLRARGLDWAEDPTNEDTAYERARTRQVLTALAPLGIDAETLANVAGHLSGARRALERHVAGAAREVAHIEAGDVVFDRPALCALDPEIARRLMQKALLWIGGGEYPPRAAPLARLLQNVAEGRGATLRGCRLIARTGTLRLTREEAALAGIRVPAGEVWDGRWRLSGPDMEGVSIAALGAGGLAGCPDRRDTGLPAATLRASPAAWRGETLVAAPLAGLGNGWTARLVPRGKHDFAALLSH